ncbi:hypothetical protein EGH73_02935 [Epilithonimonas hominis]|uniref:Uncharacterized protein n=1 Tax=Epilithonimonas hominis TaxID=420404 RepID=A0A3N0XB56_9FLAO|nr:hypothetical protein EGH73_02935 [Epilithonimonas hominis]
MKRLNLNSITFNFSPIFFFLKAKLFIHNFLLNKKRLLITFKYTFNDSLYHLTASGLSYFWNECFSELQMSAFPKLR